MTDISALYGLRLRTPRLELRLGSHEDLVELGRLRCPIHVEIEGLEPSLPLFGVGDR